MRRFIFLALFAVLLCTACSVQASEVPSNPFSSFGLFYNYVTSGSVKLKVDGRADYSSVKSFVADGVKFGGMVRSDHTGAGNLPSGTLSILSGDSYSQGRKFRLWQLSYWSGGSTASDDAPDTPSLSPYAGQFIAYHTDEYYSISELAGKRVMWNLYTSPDLVAGAAVIPNISDIKPISIGVNEIVPFIKVTRDEDSFRYDLYFVRSGDWETPIAANIPVVKVNDNSYTDFAKPYPVRKTIGRSYDYYSYYRISYAKDNANYTWGFESESENYSTIEWGDLALSAQPLTMKTGTTKNITVKLPSALKLSRDFASEDRKREILRAGNHSVLEVDYSSMKFTQGAGWNADKTHDDKSTFSFTLIAGEPGRSVLEISIPNMGAYYREIKVTDENGNLNIPEGTTNLRARVTQQARAYYVGGRPYYPSAEEGGVTVDSFSGFTGARKITQHRSEVYYDINGDKHETSGDYTYYRVPRGYAGIVQGSTHEIRRLYSSRASGDVLAFSGGAHFNTANSFDCGEYASSSLSLGNAKELESIELWLEFPESPDFNLSSIPLSKLASIDKIRTVPQQLAEFVPYFQLKHTSLDVDRMTTFEWSFVKVKADGTTEKVNPSGISNLYISVNYGDNNVEGTEGVISIDEGYWYSGRSITFSYTYDGVPYVWDFNTMNSYYDYNHFSVPDVALGASDVGYLTLYDSKDVDGIEAVIWDNDILSASPVKFTSKDLVSGGISFDVKGLKKGITKFSLVLKLTSDGYTGYRRVYRNVGVVDKITTSNIVLTPELRKDFGNFPVVEGKTYYPDNLDNEKHANVRLTIAEKMPASFFEANREKFSGTAYVSSDVGTTYANENSYGLYPYTNYDYENGIEYVTVYYDVPYSLPVGQKVRWEFPDNNIIKAGSYTMPEIDLLTPAQAKPFVKLTRKGLNLERLEWYFVDSKDNRITEPAGISAISVDVSMNYYLSNETFSDYTKKGYISVNVPEIFVSRVNFLFMKGGITYIYGFEPVDRPENYYSDDSSRVISWNVGNKNLPLLLYVGESKNVVMSAGNESADLTPYIGNSDIAGVERLSSTDKSVTVKLTGKSAGMTTITIMRRQLRTEIRYEPAYDEEGNFIGETPREYTYYGEPAPTWPREVWVASKNATTGKYEIPGLTNDAESFMNTLAADGTSASDGWTDYGHKSSGGTSPAPDAPKYDESPKDTGLAGLSIMPRFAMPKDPSKDAYNAMWNFVDTLGFPYGVDAFDDYNMRVIASRDPIAVFNEMSMDLISGDNPSLVAVVLPEIYINESGFYMFRIPVDNIKGGMRAIFLEPCRSRDIITSDDYRWRYYGESQRDDMTRQMFLDDDGNPAGAISGDEYINVAAYFIYGRYTPVIAVEATSNDIQIIKARGTPRPDVTPTSPDVKPTSPDVRPTSPDVRPTSPDVRPTSPDQPAPAPTPGTTSPDVTPTSPDTPAPTPTPGTTSPDVTPDTGHFTPKSAQPDAPGIDVEHNPVHANTARSAIIFNNPAIPANVEVRTLPDNASKGSRNVSQLPATQLAEIAAQSRDVVAVMPVMSVDTAAVYTFGVTLDNVSPDTPIYLNMTVETVTAGFVSATDDEYNSYTFLDDDGNVITTVPENHHVNVAAYMEPGKSYSPAITTDSSPSSSDKGDEGDEGGTGTLSSSGGGCESGLGLAGMAMLAALFISKRRK